MRRFLNAAFCAASICTLGTHLAFASDVTYKLSKTIDLPGNKGGHGDWTVYNPETETVWLSQSPDHAIVVIDTSSNKVAHVVPDVENSNGIGFAGQYAFAADNDSNNIVVIDQKTYDKVATLTPMGKGPDTVNYLSKEGRIYVSGTNDATEFSATKPFEVEANIKLMPNPVKDGPDIAVYVASKDKIYQPVDNVINVIDVKTGEVSVWNVGVTGSTKAAAYDSKTGHLIVGTGEKKVLVIDSDTGKVLKSIAVPGAVDATVLDEELRRAYVGDKSGVVDIIDIDSNKIVDRLPSEKNMHTLAVNTKTHTVYVYRNESNKVDVFEYTKGN